MNHLQPFFLFLFSPQYLSSLSLDSSNGYLISFDLLLDELDELELLLLDELELLLLDELLLDELLSLFIIGTSFHHDLCGNGLITFESSSGKISVGLSVGFGVGVIGLRDGYEVS